MATYYRWRQSTAEYEATKIRDNGYWANDEDEPIYLLTSRSVEYRNGRFQLVRDGTYYRYPFDFGESEYLNGQYFEVENITNQAYASVWGTEIGFYRGHVQIDSGSCYRLEATASPGTFVGYVYSTNASAYPNGGASGNYYYDQRTTVTSPSNPPSITVPDNIKGGSTITISWGAASATVGSISGYELQRRVNSGAWVQVFRGNARSATNLVEKGTNTVEYQVRAYDSNGQYSGFTAGPLRTVINNEPPTDPLNITYGTPVAGQPLSLTTEGSTDPEGDSFSYVWERSIDSGPWEEIGQTAEKAFTDTVPTSGTMYQARVKAVDSEGGSSGYATGENKAIAYNQPPTAPENIDYGTPRAGAPLILTTSGSTDPEGDAIQYVWEHRVDGGTYTQVAITGEKSVSDTVPETGSKYQARVKAVDSYGNESAYTEGPEKTISYNTPPVISGTDEDKGALTGPFSYQYTVTDAEAAESEQTLTVTEEVTNGAGASIVLRTYTATSGEENTATITTEAWLQLLDGEHTLVITASDGAEEAKRQISFSRSVTRIAASRAITTDKQPEKVFVSLYPSDRPLDSQLTLEVCNNPFDESPVWEDMTLAVDTLVHVFTNKVNTASSYGLAYRLIMTDSAQLVELIQVTLRFA